MFEEMTIPFFELCAQQIDVASLLADGVATAKTCSIDYREILSGGKLNWNEESQVDLRAT